MDSTATPNKNIQTEEYNTTTINLRELYPWYTEDTFIEVSDEVAAFLEEDKRLQINCAQYIRDNKAFYSLDAGDGIEAEALNLPEQPDEALERMELERTMRKALAQLTGTQLRPPTDLRGNSCDAREPYKPRRCGNGTALPKAADTGPRGDICPAPGAVTNTAGQNYMTQNTRTAAPVQYHAT